MKDSENRCTDSDDELFERYLQAENAIKDILYMYRTCTDYRFIFDDMGFEDGTFDPLFYIDCHQGQFGDFEVDIDLLNNGSAVKIVATLMQFAGQCNLSESLPLEYKKALKQGRFDHLPDFKEAIEYLFKCKYDQIWQHSSSLYEKYIAGYFKKLIGISMEKA